MQEPILIDPVNTQVVEPETSRTNELERMCEYDNCWYTGISRSPEQVLGLAFRGGSNGQSAPT